MSTEKTINLGNLLLSLSDAIDLVSPDIAQHQQRTAYIALELCKVANAPDELIQKIFIVSLLHDTGAITAEEKIALHNFENVNVMNHCLRGELLFRRIPNLEDYALIIRNHHKAWHDWEESIDSELVFASQIILLADYIERLIDRKQFILHQTETIIDAISKLSETIIHPVFIGYFLEISKSESFWLNIVYPRLFSLLFHTGPLRNIEINYSSLETISKFFRDIIDFKSNFTATHTVGVSAAAVMISKIFGLTDNEILEMKIAANLHDLGKLHIPNSILNKEGRLTKKEFEIIKSRSLLTGHDCA